MNFLITFHTASFANILKYRQSIWINHLVILSNRFEKLAVNHLDFGPTLSYLFDEPTHNYPRKNARVITDLQTSCNKVVVKPILGCVRTAVMTSLKQVVITWYKLLQQD